MLPNEFDSSSILAFIFIILTQYFSLPSSLSSLYLHLIGTMLKFVKKSEEK
jgi:hypothetical protein